MRCGVGGLAVVILCVAHCGLAWAQVPREGSTPDPALAETSQLGAAATDEEYLLQPGDVIEVKFFFNPELNESLVIRPDGRVSLQLVPEVRAAGRTPTALREDLIARYGQTLRHPELVVIVRQVTPRRIYVGGEVRNPSMLRVDGRVSMLQAIFEAGGVTRAGKLSDVVVLRYTGEPEPEFIKVDLRPAFKGQGAADFALKPLDIVWVPKSKIAKAGDFMDQYFRQLTPLPVALGISYVFGGLKP